MEVNIYPNAIYADENTIDCVKTMEKFCKLFYDKNRIVNLKDASLLNIDIEKRRLALNLLSVIPEATRDVISVAPTLFITAFNLASSIEEFGEVKTERIYQDKMDSFFESIFCISSKVMDTSYMSNCVFTQWLMGNILDIREFPYHAATCICEKYYINDKNVYFYARAMNILKERGLLIL